MPSRCLRTLTITLCNKERSLLSFQWSTHSQKQHGSEHTHQLLQQQKKWPWQKKKEKNEEQMFQATYTRVSPGSVSGPSLLLGNPEDLLLWAPLHELKLNINSKWSSNTWQAARLLSDLAWATQHCLAETQHLLKQRPRHQIFHGDSKLCQAMWDHTGHKRWVKYFPERPESKAVAFVITIKQLWSWTLKKKKIF